MKSLILIVALLTSFGSFASGKQKPIKVAPLKMKVDLKKSKLKWTGTKVTGKHFGHVNIKSGHLTFMGSDLKGGEFVVDMNSITCDDITDMKWNKKLVGHLKNDDFFSTDKYKTASLKIKSSHLGKGGVYNVVADLKIKNKTHPVLFDVTLKKSKKKVMATAKIIFNRAKYDIKYKSKSFFDAKKLGDKLIHDNVMLDVTLHTK